MTKEVKELNSALGTLRNENTILKEEFAKYAKELETWTRRAKDAERLIKIIEDLIMLSSIHTNRRT